MEAAVRDDVARPADRAGYNIGRGLGLGGVGGRFPGTGVEIRLSPGYSCSRNSQ